MGNDINIDLELKDDTSQPLSLIEKSFGNFYKKMDKLLGKYTDSVDEFNKETEESLDNQDKGIEKEKETVSWMSKLTKGLKAEGDALEDVGLSWKSITGIIGGATLVGIIATTVKAYLDWSQSIADLNSALATNAKALGLVSNLTQDYSMELGVAEENVKGLMRQGLEFGLLSKMTEESTSNFKDWSKQSLILSKATGLAENTVGELYYTMADLYGLGYRNLRNVGAAFKHVADMSAISSDELAGFLKNLTPIFNRLPDLSGKAKTRVTVDLMAMAGAVSDTWGDPNKMSDMFGSMLDRFNDKGRDMVVQISSLTGQSVEAIRKGLKQGNFVDIMSGMSSELHKMPFERFEEYAHVLAESTGLEYDFLLSLRKQGAEGGKQFKDSVSRARVKAREGKAAQDAALKTQTLVTRAMNKIRSAISQVWIVLGEGFTSVGKGPIDWVAEKMVSLAKWFRRESEEGGSVSTFFKRLKNFAVMAYDAIGNMFTKVDEAIPEIMYKIGKAWTWLTKKMKWFFSPAGGKQMEVWATTVASSVVDMVDGIKGIADAVRAVRGMIESEDSKAARVGEEHLQMLQKRLPKITAALQERMKTGEEQRLSSGERVVVSPGTLPMILEDIVSSEMRSFAPLMGVKGLGLGLDKLVPVLTQQQRKTEEMLKSAFDPLTKVEPSKGGGGPVASTGLFGARMVLPTRTPSVTTGPTNVNVNSNTEPMVAAVNRQTEETKKLRKAVENQGSRLPGVQAGKGPLAAALGPLR